MKRFYIWLLSFVLILSLAACGSEPTVEVMDSVEDIVEVEDPVEDVQEPEPEPEPEPESEPEPEQKPSSNSGSGTTEPAKPKIPQSDKAYLVRINLTHCTVNIYSKDESGEYTVPVKAMICSTGYATPKAGKFYRLGSTWEWLRLKGNVYGHYVTQITGNILFHSVPYLRWGDPASLEYWEFDKLGVKASQGCIRLQVCDAIWIYENAWNIVGVEFYADEDPGPFGKPTAPTISDNELCRDWDPTDPHPDNPWHDYVAGGVEEGIDPETGLPIEQLPEEGDVTDESQEGENPAEGEGVPDDSVENPKEDSDAPADETPGEDAPSEDVPVEEIPAESLPNEEDSAA